MSQAAAPALGPRLFINKTFELLADALIVVDPRTRRVMACNPFFTKVFGYQPEEVLEREISMLHVTSEMYQQFQRRVLDAMATTRRKEGSVFASEHAASEIRGDSGELVGVLSVIRDISQRKAAEERYRQIFETNTAIKLVIDPEDGSVLYANLAAAAFYGYSVEQLTSKTIFDLNPFQPPATRARMAQHSEGFNLVLSTRRRLASGGIRDVEIYTGPVALEGRLLLYGIIHNISERLQAQEKLQHLNESLEKLVRQRTARLAATVAQLQSEIVQHRKARQELEAAHQRYRTISEHTSQGVAILQGNPAHFAYVNKRMTEVFGYSAGEFRAMGPEETWKLIIPVTERLCARAPYPAWRASWCNRATSSG